MKESNYVFNLLKQYFIGIKKYQRPIISILGMSFFLLTGLASTEELDPEVDCQFYSSPLDLDTKVTIIVRDEKSKLVPDANVFITVHKFRQEFGDSKCKIVLRESVNYNGQSNSNGVFSVDIRNKHLSINDYNTLFIAATKNSYLNIPVNEYMGSGVNKIVNVKIIKNEEYP